MSKRGIRAWRAAVYATMPIAFVVATATQSLAQGKVTSPKAFFGHNIGDDYWLPNYDQFLAYWKKIDGESNRMQSVEIGKCSEGRPQMAGVMTGPETYETVGR